MIQTHARNVIAVQIRDHHQLGRLRADVWHRARLLGAGDDIAWRVVLAAHEVCTNVFVHGAGCAPVELTVEVTRASRGMRVTITDTTPPFPPPRHDPSGVTRPHDEPLTSCGIASAPDSLVAAPASSMADHAVTGGFGLTLVYALADTVGYEVADRVNTTTLDFGHDSVGDGGTVSS